jgi:hypothetical protein
MRYTHRHPSPARDSKHEAAKLMHVAVDAIERAQLSQNAQEIVSISNRLRGRETGDDPSAKGAHLVVIGARLLSVHQKIELVFVPVDVSKDLQQPRFHAAAIQSSDNVQNPHAAQALS